MQVSHTGEGEKDGAWVMETVSVAGSGFRSHRGAHMTGTRIAVKWEIGTGDGPWLPSALSRRRVALQPRVAATSLESTGMQGARWINKYYTADFFQGLGEEAGR